MFFLVSVALADPVVTLYTMGAGDDVFSRFGHGALCINEPPSQRHRCYNYGTADFTTPIPLTQGVVRGSAEFWVSVIGRGPMLNFYNQLERNVWAQDLPLTPEQAAALVAALEEDALPENRTYIYHHFDDNCTTRLRDRVDAAIDGGLSGAKQVQYADDYRSLVRDGLATSLPLLAGSEWFLGRALDRTPTMYEAMFLPTIFRQEVRERLGVEPRLVVRGRGRPAPPNALWTAWGVTAAIGAGAAAAGWRWRALAWLVSGGVGLVALAVMLISPLPALRFNELILLFWPLDLAALAMSPDRRRTYAGVRLAGLGLVGLLMLVGVLKQPLGLALLIAAALVAPALRRR